MRNERHSARYTTRCACIYGYDEAPKSMRDGLQGTARLAAQSLPASMHALTSFAWDGTRCMGPSNGVTLSQHEVTELVRGFVAHYLYLYYWEGSIPRGRATAHLACR